MNRQISFFQSFIQITIISFIFLGIFSLTTPKVHAQLEPYTTLAPLPGTTETDNCTNNCKTTFPKYLPGLFNLSIGIAALLAFVMISYGGFLYMTTDAISGKEEGREKITNAIYGLLLVIGAYAILYTINPQILNFDLNIEKPALANIQTNVLVLTPLTGADLANDASVRSALLTNGVKAYRGACTGSSTSGCVNLNGLQQSTVTGLGALAAATCKNDCVVISGGTEGGHTTGSAHNIGTAVDILPQTQINSVITNNFSNSSATCKTSTGQACTGFNSCNVYTSGGGSYLWEPKGSTCGGEVSSSGDHWHAVFK